MRGIPGHVEWKYYSHDGPELREQLLAAGLEPEDEETVVVAEAASIPPPPADVELRLVTGEFVDLAADVFGSRFDLPEKAVAVVAVVDGQPVSGGTRRPRARTPSSRASSAASPCPSSAGAGCIARPSQSVRSSRARRGYRWLYSDALPTSRPILERLGFVAITTTTPFVIPPAAR